MKSFWKYLLVVLGVFLAACLIALPFVIGWGRPWMMGRWMMRPGIMHGISPLHGFGIFRWLPWLGMVLIPLLILGLLVVGVVALLSGQGRTSSPLPSCPNCHRPVQAGWVACPYCGQGLGTGESAVIQPPEKTESQD